MTNPWKRSILSAAAVLLAAVIAPVAQPAHAAGEPCKTNAKSAACAAAQKKATAGTAKKSTASKQTKARSASAAKPVEKTSTRQTNVTGKQAGSVTVATPHKNVVARTRVREASAPAPTSRLVQSSGPRLQGGLEPQLRTPSAQAAALRSSVAYVQDLETSTVLFAKNENTVRPIASISKLMTALVVVDANLPMDQELEVTEDDIDRMRHTTSRLPVGMRMSRADMLHLALMSSENRAANALGRHYPGGMPAFVRAMNAKARELGMLDTHFVEPTGLSSENVSSPRDLVRLLRAASQRPLIHRYTTDTEYEVETRRGRTQTFRNTNALVRDSDWDIKVSKTGFINEAGECLVMLARINGRDLAIVLLDAQGKYSRIADAVRIRKFVQNEVAML